MLTAPSTTVAHVLNSGPRLLQVYWSRSDAPVRNTSVLRPVEFFFGRRKRGREKAGYRDPLYLHIVGENQFIPAAGGGVRLFDHRLCVDLVALGVADGGGVEVQDVPGLETLEFDLSGVQERGEQVTVPVERRVGDGVLSVAEAAVTAQAPGVSHVCFELTFSPDEEDALTRQAFDDYRLVAWAWVLNDPIVARYANAGGDGAGSATEAAGEGLPSLEERLGALMRAGDEPLFEPTGPDVDPPLAPPSPPAPSVDLYTREGRLALVRPQLEKVAFAAARGQLAPTDAASDHHEHSLNAVEVSAYAPVSEVALGAQPGWLGLYSDHRAPYGRDFVLGFARDASGNPWAEDRTASELHATPESLFYLRAGSAAEWLNSVERVVALAATPMRQPTGGAVLRQGELPLGEAAPLRTVRVSERAIDDGDAEDDLHGASARTYTQSGAPILTVESAAASSVALDLGRFASVAVPEAVLTNEAGEVVVALGKGFPTDDEAVRFTERTHAEAYAPGFADDVVWHTHPYVHRPLLFRYTLDGDLDALQVARWNARPPVLWFGDRSIVDRGRDWLFRSSKPLAADGEALGRPVFRSDYGDCVGFPLYLEPEQAVAGEHLVVLYPGVFAPAPPTAKHGDFDTTKPLTVRLDGQGTLPPIFDELAGEYDVSWQHDFPVYRLAPAHPLAPGAPPALGPFEGTCVASVDVVKPQRQRALGMVRGLKMYQAAGAHLAADLGEFVLEFVPGWGTVAGQLWSIGVKVAAGEIDEDAISYAGEVLGAYAGQALGVVGFQAAAGGAAKKLGRAGALAGALYEYQKALDEARDHIDRYASPARRGDAFGSLAGDLFVTAHVHKTTRRVRGVRRPPGTPLCTVHAEPNVLLALTVRDITLGREDGPEHSATAPPFVHVFDLGGGFLEAPFDADTVGALAPAGRTADLQARVAQTEELQSRLDHFAQYGRASMGRQALEAHAAGVLDGLSLDPRALAEAVPPAPAGGALERLFGPAGEAGRSARQHVLSPHVGVYLDRAAQARTALRLVSEAEAGEAPAAYLRRLADAMEAIGRGEHGGLFSGAFAAFFAERPYLAAAVRAEAEGGTPAVQGRAAAAAVGAAVQALGHVAAVALHCPACEALMDWNWGWCPYHADPKSLRFVDARRPGADADRNGVVTNEEFLQFVEREYDHSIHSHLAEVPTSTGLYKKPRLFVHFTEFRARRRSLAEGG